MRKFEDEIFEKLDLCSLDIVEEKRRELFRLFFEVRTEGGKLDFDRLKLALGEAVDVALDAYGAPVQGEDDSGKRFIQVPAGDVTAVTARLLADLPVHDITITEPPIEDVIERAFNA